MAQLTVERLTKSFTTTGGSPPAVDDVSFEIERGDFLSIIGHSGSGKTTLLSMLGGISRPSSGRVLFEGTDVHASDGDRLSEYRCRKIGFVFQFASLLTALTARENLLLPVGFRDGPRATRRAEGRAMELLALVGLGDRADAYPGQLSGGQQRRVAIARAFMNDPPMILADEPTGDLDEETEADVMKVFTTLNEEHRTTIVLVTHDTELARRAKRQMRMHRGRMMEA